MRRLRTLSISIALLGLAAFAAGVSRGAPHTCAAASNPSAASAAFDRLKALEGTWTGSGGHGDMAGPITVTYKVTSGGSAVLETMLHGTKEEMITVYYLDGDDLVLTHYCGLGNQPHMKASAPSEGKLVFGFAGGSNIAPAKDQHMHEMTMEIVSKDELRTEWHLYADGKPTEVAKFTLKRG